MAERINDIVDPKAYEQLEKLVSELNKADEAVQRLIAAGLKSPLGGYAKSVKEVTDQEKKRIKVLSDLEAVDKERAKSEKQLRDAINRRVAAEKDSANSIKFYQARVSELTQLQQRLNLATAEGRKQSAAYKAEITQLDAAIKKNGDTITNQRRNIGNYGSAFSGAFNMIKLAVAGAVAGFGAFVRASYKAYEEQIQQERRLLNALDGRKDMQRVLIAQSEELQRRTGVNDEEILKVQTLAATHGLTVEQIKKVTEATIQLSNATGQDLNTASMMLLGTFEGTVGRLGKLDDSFKTLTTEQLKNGDAVDIVIEKYKGFAEASQTASQRSAVAWNEFKERFGRAMAPVIATTLKYVNAWMEKFESGGVDKGFKEHLKTLSAADLAYSRMAQTQNLVNAESKKESKAAKEKIGLIDAELRRRNEEHSVAQMKTRDTADNTEAIKENTAAKRENAEAAAPGATAEDMPWTLTGTPSQIKEQEYSYQEHLDELIKKRQVYSENLDKLNKEEYDKTKEYEAEKQALQQEAISQSIAAVDALFAAQGDILSQQLEQLEKNKEDELKLAGDNKEKQAVIEEKYAAQKKKIDDKAKRLEFNKALFDRAIATASIIQDTARAFMAAVAAFPLTGGMPWTALITALGSLQIASVNAAPLPQYAKGRKGGPEELALVGEAGPEIITSPGRGGAQLISEPTLTVLPAGADVISNRDLMGMAFQSYPTMRDNNLGWNIAEIIRETSASTAASIVKAIKDKDELHINITEAGMHAIARNAAGWTEYVNKNIRR